jgi:hypothetical protein
VGYGPHLCVWERVCVQAPRSPKALRTDFRGDTRAQLLRKSADADDGSGGAGPSGGGTGSLSLRARRKLALSAVEEALASRSLSQSVLDGLPRGCLSEANVRTLQGAVRELVVVKGRRRLVAASLLGVVRVLVLEMRMPYGALEALTEVRGGALLQRLVVEVGACLSFRAPFSRGCTPTRAPWREATPAHLVARHGNPLGVLRRCHRKVVSLLCPGIAWVVGMGRWVWLWAPGQSLDIMKAARIARDLDCFLSLVAACSNLTSSHPASTNSSLTSVLSEVAAPHSVTGDCDDAAEGARWVDRVCSMALSLFALCGPCAAGERPSGPLAAASAVSRAGGAVPGRRGHPAVARAKQAP